MPINKEKTKAITVTLPKPIYKKLTDLAKHIDRTVANTARGLILTSLVNAKEDEKWLSR